MNWRIYYDDGTTFDDVAGEPEDAPGLGIVCIVQACDDLGRMIMSGWDFDDYRAESSTPWWGCDRFGLIDNLTAKPRETRAVKAGRTIASHDYQRIKAVAQADPGFSIERTHTRAQAAAAGILAISGADVSGFDWSKYSSVYRGQRDIIAGHVSPVDNQGAFRLRADDGSEASGGATWLENENVDHVLVTAVASTEYVRVRIEMYEADGGDSKNFTATLQYRLNGGTWTDVPTTGSVRMQGSGSGLTDGNDTTDHGITPTGTGSFAGTNAGQADVDSVAGTVSMGGNGYTFFEYAIILASLDHADTVDFRISEADNAATADYPRVTIDIPQPEYDFEDWRWRNDDGDESSTGATFMAAEHVDPGIDVTDGDVDTRLRFSFYNTNALAGPRGAWTVLYRVNAGSWTALSNGGSDAVIHYLSDGLVSAGDCTDHGVATSGTSFQDANDWQNETDGVFQATPLGLGASQSIIAEQTVRFVSANLSDGDVVEFSNHPTVPWYDTITNGNPKMTISKGAAVDDALFFGAGF